MDLFGQSDTLLENVSKKCNYSSMELLKEDVNKLKTWMETQPHLPEIMDDKRIENFLFLNKGSIERSKEKIDNYYSVRSRLPEIFDGINPKLPYLKKVMDTLYFVPLPKLTKDSSRVSIFKVRNKNSLDDYNEVHFDFIRYVLNLLEIRLAEDVLGGDVFVVDGKDISFKHVMYLTPSFVYRVAVLIFNQVVSSSLKAVYVINAPPGTEAFLMILRKFVKLKIMDRIHLGPDENFLVENIGKEILPKDYGGEQNSLEELQQIVRQKMGKHQDRFDKLDVLRVNEELRPQKLENDEMMGFHGNFKKLQFD